MLLNFSKSRFRFYFFLLFLKFIFPQNKDVHQFLTLSQPNQSWPIDSDHWHNFHLYDIFSNVPVFAFLWNNCLIRVGLPGMERPSLNPVVLVVWSCGWSIVLAGRTCDPTLSPWVVSVGHRQATSVLWVSSVPAVKWPRISLLGAKRLNLIELLFQR